MNDDEGQALVEGVLILSVLIIWIFCFLYLGRLSFSLLQWRQDLNYQTYRFAKGAEVMISHREKVLPHQLGGALAQSIHQDWNTVLKLASLYQHQTILGLDVSAQSAVVLGQGHVMDTAKIVAKSRLAWSLAYRYSQSLMLKVTDLVNQVDRVWGRLPPKEDWLRHWQGVLK